MKHSESELNQFNKLVLVPSEMLLQVFETQQKILTTLQEMPQKNSQKGLIADKFVSETTAKDMLGRGTTWFWQMRKEGKLNFKKVGNKIFYAMEDIENLIESAENE